MKGEMNWTEEFPPTYHVPSRICALVFDGVLEDMSSRHDDCPSFGARLRSRDWVRLWVEHPQPVARKGWSSRFTVIVQPDPMVLFGRRMLQTEDPEEARRCVLWLLKKRNLLFRFRIMPAERA